MEGRAVPTGTVEQAAITLQITEGRRILREVLVFGGWVDPSGKGVDPQKEARLIAQLRGRIKIDSPKEGFIRIAFSDADPDRAYRVANKLAEIYIRESGENQMRESKDAFEFIDRQVREYADKLAQYHQDVLARYRGSAPAPAAGSAAPVTPIAPRPAGAIMKPQDLAALRAERASLEEQLARRSAAAPHSETGGGAVDALRTRVAQLKADLDRANASYTDQHPDVKRLKRELAVAEGDLRAAEEVAARNKLDAQNTAALDAIASATGTTAPVRTLPVAPPPSPLSVVGDPRIDPDIKNIGQDTTLSELVRRYEATRDVYQDLLKRREAARVSMELMSQGRGSTVRVQEPAERPAVSNSLRLSHYCMIGLLLGAAAPLGALFFWLRFHRRLRRPTDIEALAKVPLLVTIGAPAAGPGRSRDRLRRGVAIAMVALVIVIYLAVFVTRTQLS
jgi:uncharacterized protein involved in exopolysaccharide biosynthesis